MNHYDNKKPTHIKARGARVDNLKNIDVDIPLNQIVGIAGRRGAVCTGGIGATAAPWISFRRMENEHSAQLNIRPYV